MASRSRMNTLGSKRRTGRRSCATRPPSRPPIRSSSRRKTPSPMRRWSLTPPCEKRSSRKCAGASRRTTPRFRVLDRALSLLRPPQRGRAAPDLLPRERRTAATRKSCSTATPRRAGKVFFDIAEARHSPDHAKLAWSADDKAPNSMRSGCAIFASARTAPTSSLTPTAALVWIADSSEFYYVRVDENHRPAAILRHRDRRRSGDRRPHLRRARSALVHAHQAQSIGAFAIISVSDHDSSECHLIDLARSRARSRVSSSRARRVCATRSNIAASGSTSAPTPTGRRISRSSSAPLATPARRSGSMKSPTSAAA